MENQAALLEQAHEASTSPGVYLMKDEKDGILYIGKAKNQLWATLTAIALNLIRMANIEARDSRLAA